MRMRLDLSKQKGFDLTDFLLILFPRQDAERYAEEEKLLFLETSAKDSSNVSELFTMLARKLPLEQAGNSAAAAGGAAGAAQRRGAGSTGRKGAGVDLRGGQGASGNQDACNC